MRAKTDMDRIPDQVRDRPSSWPVMVSAVLLSSAVAAAVSAATLRYGIEAQPHIASVRLGEITAAYTTRAASSGQTAAEVRAWGQALEAALDRVVARHGAVLLPARAVAAGAPDLTAEVEAALANILATRTGGSTGSMPGAGR